MRPDPVSRRLLRGAGRRPLILMYHATPPTGRGTRWALPLGRFVAHLELLRGEGWRTVTVSELLAGGLRGERTVAITFDDGFADNMAAAEALEARGMRATWFVVTGRLGAEARWSRGVEGRLMSAAEVRRLHEAGHEVGSHTRTHAALDALEGPALEEEVAGSRRELEDILGAPVTAFAYPYGRVSEAAARAVRAAGYRAAVTCRGGAVRPGADPLALPRLEVDGACGAGRLARMMALAAAPGSWMSVLSYLGRRVLHRLAVAA